MGQTDMSNLALSYLRAAPAQYVNREGILDKAGNCISPWGDRALISGGRNALAATEERLTKSLDRANISWGKHLFTGECCPENIEKITRKGQDLKVNLVIAVGGGKSLDAAKAAATELRTPVVCIPTIAATCAATTAVSIIYSQEGIFQRATILPKNPSLVIVDPGIIANAPVVYLESGIMDSLAKWYEGRAVYPEIRDPDIQTLAAIQLAEVLYKGFRRHAAKATSLVRQHRVEDSLIQVIDLVLFLTGVIQSLAKGTLFSGIAHAVDYGLTFLEESHRLLHGTKVGYGIIVQIHVENRPQEEIDDIVSFFRELNLKPSLKGLNLPNTREIITKIAEKAASDQYMGQTTYPVNKEIIASAMEDLERKFDHS